MVQTISTEHTIKMMANKKVMFIFVRIYHRSNGSQSDFYRNVPLCWLSFRHCDKHLVNIQYTGEYLAPSPGTFLSAGVFRLCIYKTFP